MVHMKANKLTDPDAIRIALDDGSVWRLDSALTLTCVKKAKRVVPAEELLSLF